MFIDDDKSSYQNINTKIYLLNENYKFENLLEYLNLNKDLTSKLDLDELIWRFNYDKSYEYIKDILIKEAKLLIEYGQFNSALKILELLGDYPLALNLLLVSTSPEDFDKLRIKFEAKESLNFTDNLLINHLFAFSKDSQNNTNNNITPMTMPNKNIDIGDIFGNNQLNLNLPNMNEDKMEHYHKIFDNYEGEHFIFGANQNEFKINSIEEIFDDFEAKRVNKVELLHPMSKETLDAIAFTLNHIWLQDHGAKTIPYPEMEEEDSQMAIAAESREGNN